MISVIRLIATVFQPKKETERRDVAPPRLQFPEVVMVVKQTHRLSNGGYFGRGTRQRDAAVPRLYGSVFVMFTACRKS